MFPEFQQSIGFPAATVIVGRGTPEIGSQRTADHPVAVEGIRSQVTAGTADSNFGFTRGKYQTVSIFTHHYPTLWQIASGTL